MKFGLLFKYLTKLNLYQALPVYNLNWIMSKSVYEKILKDDFITVVDVGSREGSVEELKPLESSIKYIGFDADMTETERQKNMKNNYKYSEFIPAFVGEKEDTIKFHIHHDGGHSSVYPMSDEYLFWFRKENKNPVKETIEVRSYPLDKLLINENVDFVKLDTQGNEYEILNGAKKILSKSLMMEIEVEFINIYENQKLSHEVFSIMSQNGYELIYLDRVFGKSKYFNGETRGQMLYGDALFGLSRQEALKLDVSKQLKYCLLLINYGMIDFAYDIIRENEKLKDYSPELDKLITKLNKPKPIILRIFKILIDKLIFILLFIRKTNGLSNNADRNWPIR